MFLASMKIYGWQCWILRPIGRHWLKFVVYELGVTTNTVAPAAVAQKTSSLKWATGPWVRARIHLLMLNQ